MYLLSRLKQKIIARPKTVQEITPALPLPTQEEQARIDTLRSRIIALPPLPSFDEHTSPKWLGRLHTMRNNILTKDPRSFLYWPDIISTMNTIPPALELEYLLSLSTKDAWKAALVETGTGGALPYPELPTSSGNLVHHAYHLSQLIDTYQIDLRKIDTIFEFGGGYGSMTRLAYQRGFSGTYIIFDLPEFSALQEYFLTSLPTPPSVTYLPTHEKQTVVLISDISTLETFLQKSKIDITIATWSVSEIPLDLRTIFERTTHRSTYFLFGYQEVFGGIDNTVYFNAYTARNPGHTWLTAPLTHYPGNHYLIGKSSTV